MNWIESAGGPLICLPETCLEHWNGVIGPDRKGTTDYARACEVLDDAGVVFVGPGQGLVLGDEPMATSWVPFDGGGVFVRWIYSKNELEIQDYILTSAAYVPLVATGCIFTVPGACVLFDSALVGTDLGAEKITVELSTGSYNVESGSVQPSSNTALVLIRLCKNI